jgi:kynureninase
VALTRDEAVALDAADPLAGFRERFVIADEHRLYLDGNSLGRLPRGTRERLHRLIDQWGDELVGGWPEWIEQPTQTTRLHRRRPMSRR